MKKHRDLIAVLRSHKLRITPARRVLLQFVLDNTNRRLSLREIQTFLDRQIAGVNRSSLYRNLMMFKRLGILQEFVFPKIGRRFQYVFDRKLHHFYICKACGRSNRGNVRLFKRIEAALAGVPGFAKANISAIFYSYCSGCASEKRA